MLVVVSCVPRLESGEGAPKTAHGKANKAAATKERIIKGKGMKGKEERKKANGTSYLVGLFIYINAACSAVRHGYRRLPSVTLLIVI